MERVIVKGRLIEASNGEDDFVLKFEGSDYFLAEELEELPSKTVTVRYWISDEELTDEQRIEQTILTYTGGLYANYCMCYSEITGYLYTNHDLMVGNHDLLTEFGNHIGKYLYLEVDIH